MVAYGAGYTAALLSECQTIRGPGGVAIGHEWPLSVFSLETGGTLSALILQGDARLVPPGPPDADGYPDQRPEVFGQGGMRLSHGTGARGQWQKMPRRVVRAQPDPQDPEVLSGKRKKGQGRKRVPDLLYLYDVIDPVRQMREGFAFWRAQITAFNVGEVRSIEAFYCLNFAPARLKDGKYHDETIIYAGDASYRANAWLDTRKDQRRPELVANGKIELIELRGAMLDAQKFPRYREEVKMADEMRSGAPTSPDMGQATIVTWQDIQRELIRLGVYDGKVDGMAGPKTREAVGRALERARAREKIT